MLSRSVPFKYICASFIVLAVFQNPAFAVDDEDITVSKEVGGSAGKEIEKMDAAQMKDLSAIMRKVLASDIAEIKAYREHVLANDKKIIGLRQQLKNADETIAKISAHLEAVKNGGSMSEEPRAREARAVSEELHQMWNNQERTRASLYFAVKEYPNPQEKIAYAERVLAEKVAAFRDGGLAKVQEMPRLSLLEKDPSSINPGASVEGRVSKDINRYLMKWGGKGAQAGYGLTAAASNSIVKDLMGFVGAHVGYGAVGVSVYGAVKLFSSGKSVKPAAGASVVQDSNPAFPSAPPGANKESGASPASADID